MNRIKRYTEQVFAEHKAEFGLDFAENRKALRGIATIRSKELQNEIAGYITRTLKRERREIEERRRRAAADAEQERSPMDEGAGEVTGKAWEEAPGDEARLRNEGMTTSVTDAAPQLVSMGTDDAPPSGDEITEYDIRTRFARFDPTGFEKVIARLFEKMGYMAVVVGKPGDYGADVMAKGKGETIVIQVKKWHTNVSGPDVHKTLGCMQTRSADRAIVITTSDFTDQAYDIQDRSTQVELWNWNRLRDEARKHLLEND